MSHNRSANTYQKIDTIFKRDINNQIMPYAGLVDPSLEWLRGCKFDASEKIDGTNIRIEVSTDWTNIMQDADGNVLASAKFSVSYRGKSDSASIPTPLQKFLEETYPAEKVLAAFGLKEYCTNEVFEAHKWGAVNSAGVFIPSDVKVPKMFTIYGEGYGKGIQKGGNYIPDGVGFIGFDVKIDDMYLLKENRDDILNKLGCPIVPDMGQFTIDEAIEFVKRGFKSTIAANKDYDAEGLVLKTPTGLLNRRGERIVFKVKTIDFRNYFNKYHTYDPVEQQDNPKYAKE